MDETDYHDNSKGWKRPILRPSLSEVYRTIAVPRTWPWWRKMLAFAGPGFLVSVGYMDPGNWATGLAGGAQFGYTLLIVVLLSNLMAMILQALSAKLGIVTSRDLAQACRDHYSRSVNFVLWVLCEVAIAACDLAEIIGSAVALKLLFDLPILWGVWITVLDVVVILYLQHKSFRYLEAFIVGLLLFIGAVFWLEIIYAKPHLKEILLGFLPNSEIVTHPEMLYIAIGILGATVMPHNLYLHSSIVQTRKYEQTVSGKREAIKFVTWDSTVALFFAFFINAAILIISASVFHKAGYFSVADIQDAYQLLTPLLNVPVASTLFALALLASGQNSTLTGTLAGQIVMEGFWDIRLRPWVRRLLTRLLAIIPAVIVISLYGEKSVTDLLIVSQVVLSLQLSFAVIPLVQFTGDAEKMGPFVNRWWLKTLAWVVTGIIVFLNGKYLWDFFV